MYEGIGRPDLKPRENKMKKLKEDLREEFDKKWKTVRYSEKKSEYLFLGKFQTRNEIGNALWSWIEKALQEAREEGWQTGHKQTKEDYQAKEEKVVGRVEKIKELIKTDGPWTSEYDGYDEAFDKGYNKCLEDVLSILKPNDSRCKCGNPKMDESDFCKDCI